MGIRNANRYGITLRFNREDQKKLREVLRFWGVSETNEAAIKQVLMRSFYMLYESTYKIIKDKEAKGEVDDVVVGAPPVEEKADAS